MSRSNKNNYISIAKGLGIILMVIGHSGSPDILSRFLYMFHMPLFFFCSGYFFKDTSNIITLKTFCKKKVKGLYFPYLKWSILFLILHNLFFHIDIYNSYTYSHLYHTPDFLRYLGKTIIMTDFELLIRPFWFIKALLLSSILIAFISFLRSRLFYIIGNEILLVSLFIATIVCKSRNLCLPILGDCSVLTFSAVYYYSGMSFRKFEKKIPVTCYTIGLTTIITFIGSYYFVGDIDMRYTTTHNIIPYYLLSISGIIMTFNISKWLNTKPINSYLYYIGNHTMPILALNLLALKLGNVIKICIYDLPIEMLSSYTIIYEHNSFFWVIYTIIGVSVPLLCHSLYNNIIQKINIKEKIIGNSK